MARVRPLLNVLAVGALTLAAVLTPGGAGAATGSAEAAPSLPAGAPYVALGDSYAAGYGLGDATDKPVPACGQSKLDYPHRLAAALHLDLTDVTCAGATTADVVSERQNGAPPQIDALGAGTALVTLSIGGNDSGLFAEAPRCLALSPKGPVMTGRDAPSCRSRLVRDGADRLAVTIRDSVGPGIVTAIRAAQHAAPNARIVVVGYPAIFPDPASTPRHGCFRPAFDLASLAGFFPSNSFPFTSVDTRYLHGVQVLLDHITRQAANTTGVTYVSTLAASEGRSACNPRHPFVSGVTLRSSADLRRISVVPGSLHPTVAGAAFMAKRAAAALR